MIVQQERGFSDISMAFRWWRVARDGERSVKTRRKEEGEGNPTPPLPPVFSCSLFYAPSPLFERLEQAKANTLLASKLILHLPRIPPIVISEKGKTMERLCFDHTTEVYASKYFRINFKKGIENL